MLALHHFPLLVLVRYFILYNAYAYDCLLAQYICDWKRLLYELLYGKTNETIHVPSEDTDQNELQHSLIRVIPVHSMTYFESFLYCADLRDRWMQSPYHCFVMQ